MRLFSFSAYRAGFVLLLATACSTGPVSRNANRIRFASFNVETLFDTHHDEGKSDETYLPIAKKQNESHRKLCAEIPRKDWQDACLNLDWNDTVLEAKLKNLGRVIREAPCPDVLILQEVENLSVLEQLQKNHLESCHYLAPILIEGPDLRGIDVAVLTRLPLNGDPRLHLIPFRGMNEKQKKDSRGILEVPLKLPDTSPLIVYALHLPAPFHPTVLRKQALEYLNHLQKTALPGTFVVAGGDFNLPSQVPAEQALVTDLLEKSWLVSHKVGCKDCKGTVYYAKEKVWSFFDLLLLSNNFGANVHSHWQLDESSIRVLNRDPEQKDAQGLPQSFDPKTLHGVSDHFPIYLEVVRN